MTQPSLGRIVIVPADPAVNNGGAEAPAVITRVWSPGMVNVRVLLDGRDVLWRTSLTLYPSRGAYDAARAQRDAEIPSQIGRPMHAAWWPDPEDA